MPNTQTTPAYIAARLTDKEIETLAKKSEYDAIDCAARGRDELHYEYGTVAAVLRDYVRMRNSNRELVRCLKQAIGRFKDGQFCANTKCGSLESSCSKCDAMDWRKVLAEAEKGEAK